MGKWEKEVGGGGRVRSNKGEEKEIGRGRPKRRDRDSPI